MEVSIEVGNNLGANVWDEFVLHSPQGQFYHTHGYLQNLIPGWEVIVVKESNHIVAALPYNKKKKWFMEYAIQPHFCQYLGILFGPKHDNNYKNLEFQKRAISLIVDQLPKSLKYFSYHFAPEFEYDLPLIWKGWKCESRYTYWVNLQSGHENFLTSCASHVRREIKKAKQAGIHVAFENNPELVVNILSKAKPKEIKKINPHFTSALCRNSKLFYENKQSICLVAYSEDRPIAGIIFFLFKNKLVYFQGSTLPEFKNSGAMSLIISEAVMKYQDKFDILDFDGSMVESIEKFFRGFNSYPVRYNKFTYCRFPKLIQKLMGI